MLTKEFKDKEYEMGKPINKIDDLVLVHLTDYLPQDGVIKSPKDAKIPLKREYAGREYIIMRQRDTVHFSVNGAVSSHMFGNWNNSKYGIIIPLNKIEKEKFVGGKGVDFYSKGSVKIPEGAYILCPNVELEDVKKNVPGIEAVGVDDENIVEYVNPFLDELGYNVQHIGQDNWIQAGANTMRLYEIMKENGWEITPHFLSKEAEEEENYENILDFSESLKVWKQERKEGEKISLPYCCGIDFENPKYLSFLCTTLQEQNGIKVSQEVIEEVVKTSKGKENDGSKAIAIEKASNIFNKRLHGEIQLAIMEEEKGFDFDTVIGILPYLTQQRAEDVIKGRLTHTQQQILENKELLQLYQQYGNSIYGELDEKGRKDTQKFFDNIIMQDQEYIPGLSLTSDFGEDDKRYLAYWSDQSINAAKIKGENIGIGQLGANLLNFKTDMEDNASLKEYLASYDKYLDTLQQKVATKEQITMREAVTNALESGVTKADINRCQKEMRPMLDTIREEEQR